MSGSERRFPTRLALFGAAGAAAFWYGFLQHSPAEAGRLVQRFGYGVMLITFLWWLVSLHRRFRGHDWKTWRTWLSRHKWALIFIAGVTAVAALSLPYSYKVLYDEMVLQASASNIHFFREFGTIVRGYEIEGVFRSLEVYVDKRPFFYPFIISIAHDLTGYRETNAYVVNTLLLPIGLLLVYAVAVKIGSWRAALAGLVCFGASSLLLQNANGTGMELLNVAMLAITLWLAIDYLSTPDEVRLSALVLSCVLFAQTRYESSLFVAPTAIVVVEGWRRAGRIMLPAVACVAPLLLIPCALQNTYLSGTPALWELREDVASRFAAKYFIGNLGHAAAYLFDFSGKELNSWWLSLVGIPALIWAVIALVRARNTWKTAPPAFVAAALFSLAAIANLMLLMFYFWGQLDDPIVARLVLPLNVVLTLAIVAAVEHMSPHRQQHAYRLLVAGALITFLGFGTRAIAFNADRNQLATEIAWEEKWVASQPPRSRLIITNKSSLGWLVRKISSISVSRARNTASQIEFHLRNGTFQEVLVTQYLRPTTLEGGFQLDPRDELPASYVLEPLMESRIGARLLRISRVTRIDLPPEPAVKPASSDRGVTATSRPVLSVPLTSSQANPSHPVLN